LKDTVPENEKNEIFYNIMSRLKAQACLYHLRKKPYNNDGFIATMTALLENIEAEKELHEDLSILEKGMKSWNQENRDAANAITEIMDKHDFKRFVQDLNDYLDYLTSIIPPAFLEVVEHDIRTGRYRPMDEEKILNITGSELRSIFEGSDIQWQAIFSQSHPAVKEFLQRKRAKEHPEEFNAEQLEKIKKTKERKTRQALKKTSKKLLQVGKDPLPEALQTAPAPTKTSSRRHSAAALQQLSQIPIDQSTPDQRREQESPSQTTWESLDPIEEFGPDELKSPMLDELKDKLLIKPRPRKRWSEEEVQSLYKGVAKFGTGQWAKIRDEFGFNMSRRSVDLKDKWRNEEKHPEICGAKLQEEMDKVAEKKAFLEDKNLEEEERSTKRRKTVLDEEDE